MGLIKYRVNEVAKDFGVPNKEISRILSEYKTAPKSHMQVLEDDELDVIFEYMSQHNQIESIEEVYRVPEKEEEKPKEEKPASKSGSASGKKDKQQGEKTAAPAPNAKESESAKAQEEAQPVKKKENKPFVPRKVAEKRVVDTRGSAKARQTPEASARDREEAAAQC